MEPARLRSAIESMLLVADRPLKVAEIRDALVAAGEEQVDAAAVRAALTALVEGWSDGERTLGRGFTVAEVAGGYRLRTVPGNAPYVKALLRARPARLTRMALETLAIVAYRQPVTRPEIEAVRGVDSGGVLKSLLDAKLLRILGKRDEPGRPLEYGTSRRFLEFFSLKSLKELPTLEEFQEMAEEQVAAEEVGVEVEALLEPGELAGPERDPEAEEAAAGLEEAVAEAERAATATAAALAAPEEPEEPQEPQELQEPHE